MNLDNRVRLFVVLAAAFCTALIVADLIGVKLFEVHLGSLVAVMPVGMIAFPVTFVLTDLLHEFYGKKAARFVTWLGLFMSLFTFATISIATAIEWAPMTRAPDYRGTVESSFNNVFGTSQRILIASMVAYVLSQLCDIAVFHLLKRLSHNRMLWLRSTGSTVVSQLIDTTVFQLIAWLAVLPTDVVINIIVTSYMVKLLVAVGLTPIIYAGHALVERWLGMKPIQLTPGGEPIFEDSDKSLGHPVG
ncbi:queuosine precursor transporter [Hyalangium versicolor]|uniref:queuosine precursor transporter n=1 Tax=Hyalangium versicolor TaxID=2861190 RepID=UPI001CCA43D0|nr:queuosine precursor transporter [Hyalangium versicolor]